jgi:hypothetical protein
VDDKLWTLNPKPGLHHKIEITHTPTTTTTKQTKTCFRPFISLLEKYRNVAYIFFCLSKICGFCAATRHRPLRIKLLPRPQHLLRLKAEEMKSSRISACRKSLHLLLCLATQSAILAFCRNPACKQMIVSHNGTSTTFCTNFPNFTILLAKGQDKHWALNFGYRTFKWKHTEEIQRVYLCCGKLQANYTLFLFSFPNGSPFAIINTWAFFIHLLPQRSRHHIFIAHLIPESHESRQKVKYLHKWTKRGKGKENKEEKLPKVETRRWLCVTFLLLSTWAPGDGRSANKVSQMNTNRAKYL